MQPSSLCAWLFLLILHTNKHHQKIIRTSATDHSHHDGEQNFKDSVDIALPRSRMQDLEPHDPNHATNKPRNRKAFIESEGEKKITPMLFISQTLCTP